MRDLNALHWFILLYVVSALVFASFCLGVNYGIHYYDEERVESCG